MATPEAPAASARAERRHGLWIFAIWLPLAVIADLLIWFVWKPHLPPGTMSTSAQHQQFDIAVMAVVGAPVLLFVWTYAAYALSSAGTTARVTRRTARRSTATPRSRPPGSAPPRSSCSACSSSARSS